MLYVICGPSRSARFLVSLYFKKQLYYCYINIYYVGENVMAEAQRFSEREKKRRKKENVIRKSSIYATAFLIFVLYYYL